MLFFLQTIQVRKKSRIAVINEFIFLPLHISAPLPPPLCIIHHIGLLPCFPGLFLPSIAITLTESPQSPAAPNRKPLTIWIMDYIPLFPPSLFFPLSPFYAFLFFPSLFHSSTLSSLPFFSRHSIPVLILVFFNHSFKCSEHLGRTNTTHHFRAHCWPVGNNSADTRCPRLPQTVNSSRVDTELGSSP